MIKIIHNRHVYIEEVIKINFNEITNKLIEELFWNKVEFSIIT